MSARLIMPQASKSSKPPVGMDRPGDCADLAGKCNNGHRLTSHRALATSLPGSRVRVGKPPILAGDEPMTALPTLQEKERTVCLLSHDHWRETRCFFCNEICPAS